MWRELVEEGTPPSPTGWRGRQAPSLAGRYTHSTWALTTFLSSIPVPEAPAQPQSQSPPPTVGLFLVPHEEGFTHSTLASTHLAGSRCR